MTMTHQPRHSWILGVVFAGALTFALAGCGGDDDGPTNPGGGNPTPDAFDQATAMTQAEAAANQAVDLVESMADIAAGFTKEGEKDYAWNEQTQRWEYDYTFTGDGYVYDWLYTVQYLGPDGTPQQTPQGATTVAHAMNGTGSYRFVGDGAVLDYDYVYEYATTITGVGSGTMVMTGGGGQDIDYTYTSPQGNYAATYDVGWEILPPGITVSGSGCPVGTIRYDFAPYHALVVFDGGSMATSTLYDGAGSPVAGGGRTHPLSCGTR